MILDAASAAGGPHYVVATYDSVCQGRYAEVAEAGPCRKGERWREGRRWRGRECGYVVSHRATNQRKRSIDVVGDAPSNILPFVLPDGHVDQRQGAIIQDPAGRQGLTIREGNVPDGYDVVGIHLQHQVLLVAIDDRLERAGALQG